MVHLPYRSLTKRMSALAEPGLLLLLLVIVDAILSAYLDMPRTRGEQAEKGVISLRRLSLRDNQGRDRLNLGVGASGDAFLQILDVSEFPLVSLVPYQTGNMILGLSDKNARNGPALGIREDGASGIWLVTNWDTLYYARCGADGFVREVFWDRESREREARGAAPRDGSHRLSNRILSDGEVFSSIFMGTGGRPSVNRICGKYNYSRVELRSPDRRIGLELGLNESGTASLDLGDRFGTLRASFACHSLGNTTFRLFDPGGKERLSLGSVATTWLTLRGQSHARPVLLGMRGETGECACLVVSDAQETEQTVLRIDRRSGPALLMSPR